MCTLDNSAIQQLTFLGIDPEEALALLAEHPYKKIYQKRVLYSPEENIFKIKQGASYLCFSIYKLNDLWIEWTNSSAVIDLKSSYSRNTPCITYATGERAWLEIPDGLSPRFKNHTLSSSEVKQILTECEKFQRGGKTDAYLALAMYASLLKKGYL